MKPTETDNMTSQANSNNKPTNIQNQYNTSYHYNTNCQQFFAPIYGATFTMPATTPQQPGETGETATAPQQPGETGEAATAEAMPDILATEKAAPYWKRLQERGFVDAQCKRMPTTTRQQAMYIAEAFAKKLNLTAKWKSFESLWGISNLAQEKHKMQETGLIPPRYKEIIEIFDD